MWVLTAGYDKKWAEKTKNLLISIEQQKKEEI